MEPLYQHSVGDEHIVDLSAGGFGRDWIDVQHEVPFRVTREQERRVCDVGLDIDRFAAG